jgi:hypothetical protein
MYKGLVNCVRMPPPNGPELSCGADNFTYVLSAMRSNIGGAWLLQIHFFARSEFVPKLQPSA